MMTPLLAPPMLPARTVSVAVARDFPSLSVTREVWDNAAAGMGGSVYMTYDWLLTWWNFYGKGRELRLFVCSEGDRIVALLPIYIDSIGFRPLRLRVARLAGANLPPKVFDPAVDPEHAEACFQKVISLLFKEDQCDIISLGPASAAHAPWAALSVLMRHAEPSCRITSDATGVHTLFRPPDSMEDYLKSLSKNEQKNRRKYELRTLRKEYEVKVELLSDPGCDLVAEFDRFAPLHTKQWEAEGKPGHFGAWPQGLAYNRALVNAMAPLGRVRFIRITAGDQVVSSQYTFAFAGRWYWELPARIAEPGWDRFSLGPSGIVTMIGEAIGEGVHWIQGGLGHYDYKLRLKAEEIPVITYRITRNQWASRLRQTLFSALRGALRLAYHKIWYRRIMPRLPAFFRRPQWTLWLRFDY